MMRLLLPLVLLAVLAVPVTAQAAQAENLWATVNVCDAPSARNVIGLRGSMPAGSAKQRVYMHFSAEWYSASKKRWMATGASSPWIRLGNAGFLSVQGGYSFQFADPPSGTRFLMRGVVRYQWRAPRSGRLLRRATRVTRAGLKRVAGGLPAGRSDAACVISS